MCPFRPGGVRDKITGNLFVRGLPEDCKSIDLYRLFADCGKIFSCRVKYNPNGKCKGYGYVQYDNKEDADKAISEMNGKPFKNGKLMVEPFKSSSSRVASFMNYNNLFIKNVPKKYAAKDVIDLFAAYGEIVSAVVIKEHPDAAENKGFGFVCFKKAEDAKNAETKLNKLILEGKNLYVCRALPKDEHKRQLREDRLRIFKDCNLYVKELPEDIDNDKLKEAFSEFGKVVSAIVMLEKKQNLSTGLIEMKSRGFGFVCFSNREEAARAVIEAPTKQIFGRVLYVAIAEKKEDRFARMSVMHFPGPRPGMFPPFGISYGFPLPRKSRHEHEHRRRQYPPTPTYPAEPSVRELPEDKETLGEYLYPLVEERAPQFAAKITGMFLEMEVKQLHNLIRDTNQLDKWVAKALSVLNKNEKA